MSFAKDLCIVLLLSLARTVCPVDGTSMLLSAAEGATAVHLHVSDSASSSSAGNWNEDKKTSLTLGPDNVLLSAPASLLTSSALTTSPPSINASTATLISSSATPQPAQKKQPCYFPSEYRGIYQVQSSTDAEGRVQYDQVEIGPQEISVWGTCHSFTGQHVLLHISTESGDCFRCFHVVMRTGTILQVNTEGLEKCYTSEATARSKCPSPATIKPGDGIFLWRKSGSIEGNGNAGTAPLSSAGQNIYRTLCPLDGEFTFRYYVNGSPLCETGNTPVSNLDEGQEHAIRRRNTPPNDEANDAEHALSTISNCPSRDTLHATFRSCQFTDRETTFKCLGTWPGEDGQTYIGLMDFYDDSYAKYRCALFKEEKKDMVVGGTTTSTSVFHVSLSPDSSCSNELHNASSGFETLELYPISKFNKRKIKSKIRDLKRKLTVENSVPATEDAQPDVTRKPLGRLLFAGSKNGAIFRPFRKNTPDGADALDENVTCKFADWMQGNWQHFTVKDDDLFLKELPSDTTLFDGYPMGKQQQMCVGRDIKVPGQDEKILVYSTTSCGEEYVSCMWARKGDHGTMEYRRGLSIPVNDITLLKRQTLGEIQGQTSTFPPFEICEDSFFQGSPWITQMSLDQPQRPEASLQKTASCPFLGELEAELGRGEKCAAFSSHCGTSDVFEYKIRSCKHPKSGRHSSKSPLTYDERHYRCISSWNDKGYNIFLTERLRGEEVNQINGPFGSTVRRETRNPSSTDNIETQCFVMKTSMNDSSYVIASLSSNCERMAMGSSWEDFLAQNGLRFRLTANCSSALLDHPAQANHTEVMSNEIPRNTYRSSRLHNTNTSDISFNEIVADKITSAGVRPLTLPVLHWISFVIAGLVALTSRRL